MLLLAREGPCTIGQIVEHLHGEWGHAWGLSWEEDPERAENRAYYGGVYSKLQGIKGWRVVEDGKTRTAPSSRSRRGATLWRALSRAEHEEREKEWVSYLQPDPELVQRAEGAAAEVGCTVEFVVEELNRRHEQFLVVVTQRGEIEIPLRTDRYNARTWEQALEEAGLG